MIQRQPFIDFFAIVASAGCLISSVGRIIGAAVRPLHQEDFFRSTTFNARYQTAATSR